MAPKPKGNAAPEVGQAKGVFSEVEKAMYEMTIGDLNRKLARLRTAVQEYEQRNEELQNSYDKLDEDRADIIAYLKRTLNVKTEENTEFKEKIKSLEELRDEETKDFKEKSQELERNFNTMKAQLTSENKLLAGKINTLEEFRAIRDDLMLKFERQEQAFADQEMKYKRLLYETEKKFIIGKDKLKKEMEARLLGLAQDFQDASESRIAASTHRVIRENIALNNQLDNLLMTQAKVADQNEKLKEAQISARIAMEVAEAERDKAINKSVVQLKVIDKLTMAYRDVQKEHASHQRKLFDHDYLHAKVEKLKKDNENMALQLRIIEQNLHASKGEQNTHTIILAKLTKERDTFRKIIKEAISAVRAAMKTDQWSTLDPTREVMERKVVLKNIISVLEKHKLAVQVESVESLISFSDIYEKGDLGFVPKRATGFEKPSRMSVLPSESYETFKSTSVTAPSLESTVVSLKAVPSIAIIPKAEEGSITEIESIPSFTITSIHSSISEESASIDTYEAMTDVEKQLAQSKLEIQKSILKDLVMSQGSRVIDTRSNIDLKPRLSQIDSQILSATALLDDEKKAEGGPIEEGGPVKEGEPVKESGPVEGGESAPPNKEKVDKPIEEKKEDTEEKEKEGENAKS